jgi:hypothetical protein
VIELYPSGIGLTISKSSFHGRMSSARSIDLPGLTHLQLGSRLAGNLAGHFLDQAAVEVTGRRENGIIG